MLNENIKFHRKAKGISQEELAAGLHITRQTLSKWENGLSVPDAEMLIRLSYALDTTVSELLGDPSPAGNDTDSADTLAAKLEILNRQYSKSLEQKRKTWRIVFIVMAVLGGIYLMNCLWTAGILLHAVATPPSAAGAGTHTVVSGAASAAYKMMLPALIRILLPPIAICIIAVIGIRKTARDI